MPLVAVASLYLGLFRMRIDANSLWAPSLVVAFTAPTAQQSPAGSNSLLTAFAMRRPDIRVEEERGSVAATTLVATYANPAAEQ